MKEILTIWKKELVDSIRDRRTLVTAVIMPIVLMPVILIGSIKFQEYQQKEALEKPARVALEQTEQVSTLRTYLESHDRIEIVEGSAYEEQIENGELDVYLGLPELVDEKLTKEESFLVRVIHKSSILDSATAVTKVMGVLQEFNSMVAANRLEARTIDPAILTPLQAQPVDIATAEERGGFFVGFLLPMFIVLFAIVGGMYIAIDVSAGEKERKTLEALLLTPASRLKIVAGKFAAVATTASTTIVLSLFSLYAAFKMFPPDFGDGELVVNLTPASIALMIGIGIILAIMFAGMLLSVAIFAKSYKEAQNYITPFYLVAVLPVAILGQLPGFKPTDFFFVIPGVNAVFIMKEVLLGDFNAGHIAITILSLFVFAAISIFIAGKIYSKEGVLFRD